jgi:hypothetical protein
MSTRGLKVPFGGAVHRHKVLLPEKKEVQKVAVRGCHYPFSLGMDYENVPK